MSKKEKVGFGVITIVAVAYFIYHFSHVQKEQSNNIFLEDKPEVKSLATDIPDEEIFKLDGRAFKFSELPEELQKEIRNNQMIAHTKINTLLKDYAISYHLATIENPGKKVDTKNLPKVKMTGGLKTDMKMIEGIYEKNKHKFPANHNPEDVKTNLAVKILGGKIEAFLKQNLKDMYKNNSLALPEFPQLPDNWFNLPVTQHLGDPSAENHLVWIGNYVDPYSEELKESIGLLIKKYGLTDFKISFIPRSNAFWDFPQALNLRALCVSKLYGSDAFWSFHSQLLKLGTELVKVRPKEREKSAIFTKNVMKNLGYKTKEVAAVEACADNKDKKNPLYLEILKAQKDLLFIPNDTLPIFIFNRRYLDLAGRSLLEAVEDQIKSKEPKS